MRQNKTAENIPRIIPGAIHTDERGQLSFVNDFTFKDVSRFYLISHPNTEIIRAWQGHKIERKYFYVVSGTFLICAVKIDDWSSPSQNLDVFEFKLSEEKSQVLVFPEGYANGFRALKANSQLIVFSSLSLSESKNDDHRFPKEYWYNWN